MTVSNDQIYPPRLHSVHGVLLAAAFALFFCGLLSDLAYASSYQIQWVNFASWLITGGLIFGGIILLWAILNLFRSGHKGKYSVIYTLLLLATWVLGLLNSLIHARDAWATMPGGLILSVVVVLLSCASVWLGFATFGVGGRR
ncbi:DUF2231 domain-containing protein [Rheinheimera sp. EpRS3]|uniref:DUF2231 domain-containing protein n=1 Tax=Rheinheimera sp. EpRS3 TaxID=1712383 RepID=UPI00074A2E5A|nr:DUF2231 domain-containing protein [Rheinheimera sp. EpRS3]KUM51835.1 hypothetical protein AR688_00510 [Rheinheimera sp. EpRS3]